MPHRAGDADSTEPGFEIARPPGDPNRRRQCEAKERTPTERTSGVGWTAVPTTGRSYSLAPSAIITSVGRMKRMNAPDRTRPPTMLTMNGTRNIRSSPRS